MKECLLLQSLQVNIKSTNNDIVQLDCDSHPDWQELYSLAQSQQVLGMVYNVLRDSMPEEYLFKFKQAYSAELFNYVNRKEMMDTVYQALEDAGISCFAVKGALIGEYYPNPALRTMGDVDLIVREADIPKVNEILLSIGFEFTSHYSGMERIYKKKSLTIELHHELCYEEDIGNNDAVVKYFSNHWDYVQDNQLDWNYHFLYMLVHLRKHIINSGVGFRQFMDIAVAIKYSDLDMEWITDEAIKIGMGDFLENVLALNYRWFEIKPEGRTLIDIDEDFYEYVTDKIFKDGVFGFDNEDNRTSGVAAQMARDGAGTREGRIKWMLWRVFPSYEEMRNLNYIKYIDGRKYLLPVAWVHRIIKRIPEKDRIKKITAQVGVEQSKIDERIDMFKKWGL